MSHINDLTLASERLVGRGLTRPTMLAIGKELSPDESVYEIATGIRPTPAHSDPTPVTAVVTNQRILVLEDLNGSHAPGSDAYESYTFPRDNHTQVLTASGLALSEMTLRVKGLSYLVVQVPEPDMQQFLTAVAHTVGMSVNQHQAVITDASVREELAQLDGLYSAGHLSWGNYHRLRRPILQHLGLKAEEIATPAPDTPDTKKTATILGSILASVILLAVIIWLLVDGDDNEDAEPVAEPTATEEPAETEESSEPEQQPEEDEEALMPEEQEQESPEPAPTVTETVEAEAPETPDDPNEPTENQNDELDQQPDSYDLPAAQQMTALIDDYLNAEDTAAMISDFSFGPEEVTMILSRDADLEQSQAESMSEDIIEILAEDNDVIDEPTHDAQLTVPFGDQDESVIATFDRDEGQYQFDTE